MARSIRVIIVSVAAAMMLVGAGCRLQQGDQFAYPTVGSTATFQAYPHWGIAGTVTVVDAHTLRLDDFSFHGEGLAVDIRLQRGDTRVAVVADLTTKSYDHATVELAIPEDVALTDFNLVTVFCPALSSPVSGAAFK